MADVKMDLKTPVWDENKRLYRPGKGVMVPSALAAKLQGKSANDSDSAGSGGGASLDGVDFASDAAREAAVEAGLTSDSFKDAKPSGANGFTKPDVQALAEKA